MKPLRFAVLLDMPGRQITIGPRNEATRAWLEEHGIHFFDEVLADLLEAWKCRAVSERNLPEIAAQAQRLMVDRVEGYLGLAMALGLSVRACRYRDVVITQELEEIA